MAGVECGDRVIVEFTTQQPTLLQSLRSVPSARAVWERMDTTDEGTRFLLFWAESEDVEAFEAAMGGDPTVSAPECLTVVGDRRLYRVEVVGDGRARSVYPTLVEVGGIVQHAAATGDGWTVQAMLPDGDALTRIYEACSDHDLEFTLRRKYRESGDSEVTRDFGLTEKQRRMLIDAVERGYYKVPRENDLETIADDLGISHQAASERLRRAIDLMVRNGLMDARERPARGEVPSRKAKR